MPLIRFEPAPLLMLQLTGFIWSHYYVPFLVYPVQSPLSCVQLQIVSTLLDQANEAFLLFPHLHALALS